MNSETCPLGSRRRKMAVCESGALHGAGADVVGVHTDAGDKASVG